MSVFPGEAQRWADLGVNSGLLTEHSTGSSIRQIYFQHNIQGLRSSPSQSGNILETDKITTRETNWLICGE